MSYSNLIRPGDHILFQGDSITYAFRKPEEVCNAYQLGAGYAMMAAARLLDERPDDGLSFSNRGIAGEGVDGLRKRWQKDCVELQPDVLSILVGVNDATRNQQGQPHASLEQYESRYRDLLTATREALPKVRLVLCEPFLLDVADAFAQRGDVPERTAIVRQLATEFKARLVPFAEVFEKALERAPARYWSFDGIHPNAQGHWLMAQSWLSVVTGR